jgi:hypothetical protein
MVGPPKNRPERFLSEPNLSVLFQNTNKVGPPKNLIKFKGYIIQWISLLIFILLNII